MDELQNINLIYEVPKWNFKLGINTKTATCLYRAEQRLKEIICN